MKKEIVKHRKLAHNVACPSHEMHPHMFYTASVSLDKCLGCPYHRGVQKSKDIATYVVCAYKTPTMLKMDVI